MKIMTIIRLGILFALIPMTMGSLAAIVMIKVFGVE
jgi:hypothetical protein